MDVHLVHERKEEAAELAVWLLLVIQHAASVDPTACTSEHDDGELIVIVTSAGHHA